MADRLSEERKTEIYRAALRLIREVGYDKVTMENLARASHASTATLYRRWKTKARLVADALEHLNPSFPAGPDIDTGSFLGDLHQAIDDAVNNIESDWSSAADFITALQFAATREPELSDAFKRSLGGQMQPLTAQFVERAVARGEIRAGTPALEYLPVLLLAPNVLTPLAEEMQFQERGGMHAYIDDVIAPLLGLTPEKKKEKHK